MHFLEYGGSGGGGRGRRREGRGGGRGRGREYIVWRKGRGGRQRGEGGRERGGRGGKEGEGEGSHTPRLTCLREERFENEAKRGPQ